MSDERFIWWDPSGRLGGDDRNTGAGTSPAHCSPVRTWRRVAQLVGPTVKKTTRVLMLSGESPGEAPVNFCCTTIKGG